MIEVLPDMPEGVTGIRVSGWLRGEDLHEFKPAMEPLLKSGEIRIVGPPLDDRLFFNECLIFPVEIQPRLDRNRTVYPEPPLIGQRMRKIAHFAPGIWVQFECPLDPISRDGVACRRLESPVGEPGPRHMRRNEAR